MRPWVSRIAQNVVIDHFRADATQLKWLDRAVEVQELPPDPAAEGEEAETPPEDPTAPPRPVEIVDERRLVTWLRNSVRTPSDRLTLEMLVEKATTQKSNAAIAAEHGMTEAAFDNRLLRFKARWIPQWKRSEERRKQNLMLMVVVFVLAAAAAIVWWVLHGPKKTEPIGPTEVPVLAPAPTASGPEFDNAQPTQPRDTQPPREEGRKPEGNKK
jgi:DNA-directed RNA polymerase specialized sigma24 family protein